MKKITIILSLGYFIFTLFSSFAHFQEHFIHIFLIGILTFGINYLTFKEMFQQKRKVSFKPLVVGFVPIILFIFLISHVLPIHALAGHVSSHSSVEHPCCVQLTPSTTVTYIPPSMQFVENIELSSHSSKLSLVVSTDHNKSPPFSS